MNARQEDVSCRHCGSMNVTRKGSRTLSVAGKRQIYLCKNCSHKFSLGLSKKKFNAKLIVNAVCAYNKGYSYAEVSEMMSRKHKTAVGKSSVERWVKEYGLGYLDIRDRIASKYGTLPVVEKMFRHSGVVYDFKFHRGKLHEFGKFPGLKSFVVGLGSGVDSRLFEGDRCSQARDDITAEVDAAENTRLNKVAGEMLKIVRDNYQRHALVEDLMLCCDRDTVAVEVPVWYWDKFADRGICGHIDVLQVKFGNVWIMDYKPDAEKEKFEKVVSQLYHYALALSFRAGVPLDSIRCAWFDAAKVFSFEPAEARVRQRENVPTGGMMAGSAIENPTFAAENFQGGNDINKKFTRINRGVQAENDSTGSSQEEYMVRASVSPTNRVTAERARDSSGRVPLHNISTQPGFLNILATSISAASANGEVASDD